MHRKVSLVIILLIIMLLSPNNAYAFTGAGAGTSGNPYQVTTCAQLEEVANELTAYYLQKNDIDCTGVNFIPIGDNSNSFDGTYDGNGFKLHNLDVGSNDVVVGLFAVVGATGTVTKVGFESGSVVGGNNSDQVGAIAGRSQGTITESYSKVYVTTGSHSGNEDIGGLVGLNSSGTISDSYSTGDVQGAGDGSVGGLVGTSLVNNISRVYTTGQVSGGFSTGGIVGYLGSGSLIDSFSDAEVDSNAPEAHGLIAVHGGFLTNGYWNSKPFSPNNCHDLGNTNCTVINNNSNYFYSITNAPMNSWDFNTIWSPGNDGTGYPVLRAFYPSTQSTSSDATNGELASTDSTTPGECNDTTPTFVPHLFEIDAAGSFATLNFTASKQNVSGYSISYGLDMNANNYGENFNYDTPDWLIHHSIWKLPEGNEMYFRVRAVNGCTAGEWSNVVKVKTGKKLITQFFP